MAALSEKKIADLLDPYLGDAVKAGSSDAGTTYTGLPELYQLLSRYLDLLLTWNARTNLTAVRSPEEMVTRHFGESLLVGQMVAEVVQDGATALDFGSGAGFPGLPVQVLLPGLRVTLAESQGKKAAFLREATRVLGTSAEVWARRVEEMPANRQFNVVMLRAVDQTERMIPIALDRLGPGGYLFRTGTVAPVQGEEGRRIPGSSGGWIVRSIARGE
ncbi:MAG: 16S rRNA (guanine(527)-N(7))-methyltransferase RsmG [Janthinobacterium lividum]